MARRVIYSYVTDDRTKVRWTCDPVKGVDTDNYHPERTAARVAYTTTNQYDHLAFFPCCFSQADKTGFERGYTALCNEYHGTSVRIDNEGGPIEALTIRWLLGEV